jgi:uroporphyrinogen-III synthase
LETICISRLRIINGIANSKYAARHFQKKKYNCVIVTSVKAFELFGGSGTGGCIFTVGVVTGASFPKSSSLDID